MEGRFPIKETTRSKKDREKMKRTERQQRTKYGNIKIQGGTRNERTTTSMNTRTTTTNERRKQTVKQRQTTS